MVNRDDVGHDADRVDMQNESPRGHCLCDRAVGHCVIEVALV